MGFVTEQTRKRLGGLSLRLPRCTDEYPYISELTRTV